MAGIPQLYEEDIQVMDDALESLLEKSDASGAMVIDKGGFLITQQGDLEVDTVTLAALASASFAANESIAGLVQERTFSTVFQQGDNYSMLILAVDDNCLLVVIFINKSTTVGAVKHYAAESVSRLADQFIKAEQRDPDSRLDLSVMNLSDPSGLFKQKDPSES